MMKLMKIILIVGISIAIFGCESELDSGSRNQAYTVDTWYRKPPKSFYDKIAANHSPNNTSYCMVIPKMEKKAVSLLEKEPIASLTANEAKTYCGNQVEISKRGHVSPFLVRALTVLKKATDAYATDAYSATYVSNKLWVDNGAFRRDGKPAKMYRRALVVF